MTQAEADQLLIDLGWRMSNNGCLVSPDGCTIIGPPITTVTVEFVVGKKDDTI